MKLVLASLALLAAPACGIASAGPRPALPTLVTRMTEGARINLAVNDLPVTRWELEPSGVLADMTDLPPYYFRTGTNTLRVRYNGDIATYPDLELSLVVAQLSAAERKAEADREPWDPMARPQTVLAELVPDHSFTGCASGKLRAEFCEVTLTFEVAAALPQWGWVGGDPIRETPESRAALRRAYVRLHDQLVALIPVDGEGDRKGPASRAATDRLERTLAAGMPDMARSARIEGHSAMNDLADMFSLIRHSSSGLHDLLEDDDVMVIDPGDEMRMEIFAGGKLARLWHGIPLFYVQGGAHDAPSGTLGPYSIGFDVWWRLDGTTWTPAAIWRIDPMVELPGA